VTSDGATRPLVDSGEVQHEALGAWLFLLLQRDRPREPSARYRLNRDVVVLGRGARGHRTTKHERTITIDDPWMSTSHAKLVREASGWFLEDAGSRNGTVHQGVAVERVALRDGDIIEVGRTFLLFRAALPTPIEAGDLDDEAQVASFGSVFRTLSPGLATALGRLARVAASPLSIVLIGETGTGKEVFSRALHQLSERRGPFVAVNCAALPDSLVHSELFGHKKGAFSSAIEDRPGHVRSADRGTLLLDELADLTAAGQGALLRVLQEREVVPVGDQRPIAVDVRVIGATNRELATLSQGGSFREDLLARLSGFVFRIPPLRDRREDLGLLLRALISAHAPDPRTVTLGQEAARLLLAHRWLANVRELETTIAAAIAQAGEGPIQAHHLPEQLRPQPPQASAPRTSEADDERRARLVRLLTETRGNISQVARTMGTARAQIHRWLRRYELDPDTFR
jgi:transcriptional regulator with GAF, ATPase, and Fis domain